MLKLNSQEKKKKKKAILPELGGFSGSTKNVIGKVPQAQPKIRPMRQERERKIYLQNKHRSSCCLWDTGTG